MRVRLSPIFGLSRDERILRRVPGALAIAFALVVVGAMSFSSKALHAASAEAPLARPLVIAHRGASGYRPEHTLESYRLAIELGADYIEPDLVATRDGVLVARHEPDISLTTDVATRAEFADRKRRIEIDGVMYEGWFTVDFSLQELRTLRAIQPREDRSKEYDGLYSIPTLQEIIDLAQTESKRLGRTIGIYPETKHPSWHCSLGLALEPALLEALQATGWQGREAPVFIQSFESGNLRWLRERSDYKLIQLIAGAGIREDGTVIPWSVPETTAGCELYPVGAMPKDYTTVAAFEEIAQYADGIGPWKRWIVSARPDPERGGDAALEPTSFIRLAHATNLVVHPWTFRNEAKELLIDYGGSPAAEYQQFYALGVDGVFSDFPDTARAARDK
jgi:glycerophosphoryl diester phosphodiesterase